MVGKQTCYQTELTWEGSLLGMEGSEGREKKERERDRDLPPRRNDRKRLGIGEAYLLKQPLHLHTESGHCLSCVQGWPPGPQGWGAKVCLDANIQSNFKSPQRL